MLLSVSHQLMFAGWHGGQCHLTHHIWWHHAACPPSSVGSILREGRQYCYSAGWLWLLCSSSRVSVSVFFFCSLSCTTHQFFLSVWKSFEGSRITVQTVWIVSHVEPKLINCFTVCRMIYEPSDCVYRTYLISYIIAFMHQLTFLSLELCDWTFFICGWIDWVWIIYY